VLLVEDHEDTALMMEKMLSMHGHEVVAATSVVAALAALQAGAGPGFDLVVSDIGLPDGTGYDLMRRARQEFGLAVPAIAITGYGMEEDIARARAAGFDLHLTKPINVLHLYDAVRRALAAR
jgi:CheY-like chemotaxis protein